MNILNHRWISYGERLQQGASALKVSGLIDKEALKWKVNTMQQLLPVTDIGKVLQTPFSFTGAKDSLFWPYGTSRDYSVKSRYKTTKMVAIPVQNTTSSSNHPSKFLWQSIWGANVPQKIKNFLWRACHNASPVKTNLCRMNLERSDQCPVYGLGLEDVTHMLLLCH